jgi:hypothetical protein
VEKHGQKIPPQIQADHRWKSSVKICGRPESVGTCPVPRSVVQAATALFEPF